MTTQVALQEALLTGGLERVSWWNGRVLTAEDLSDLQRATDGADLRLGRAIGAGVVQGLTVRAGADGRSVEVAGGLAVDRAGEVLALPDDVTVPLVTPPDLDAGHPAGFVTCEDVPTGTTGTGHGAYLLTIGSAAATRGSAAGADVGGLIARECGPRYLVAGVQFRLVGMPLEELALDAGHDAVDDAVLDSVAGSGELHPRARNVVAALFLDAVPRRRALIDPFGVGASRPALLDLLHDEGLLADCEVPLAVIAWSGGTVRFVDGWAVRRPPRHPAERWPARVVGPGGARAGLATLLQFTDHLAELVGPGRTSSERAALRLREVARYVPPAMLLPRVASGHPQGITLSTFLQDIARRGGGQLAGSRVWPLVDASLAVPPIDLDGAEHVHTYEIREAVGAPGVQPATLVATEHLTHLTLAPEEEADRLVITSVSPAGEHQVGDEISVHGRNFASPTSLNTVTVGGTRVHGFNPPTNPEVLTFSVPNVADLPRVVPIVVSAPSGSDEYLVSVVERVAVPEGQLHYRADHGDLEGEELAVGETYVLWWWVTAMTNRPVEARFQPRFTQLDGATVGAWESAAVIVDADEVERDTFTLLPPDPDVEGSGPIRVGVHVQVPEDARAVSLALRATVDAAPEDPDLNAASGPVRLQVGEAVEPSDPRVTLPLPMTTEHARVTPDGEVIVQGGNLVRVQVQAHFTEPGTFVFSASLEPGTGPWELTRPDPPPEQTWDEDGDSLHALQVVLQSGASGPSTERVLRFHVEQVGDEHEHYAAYRLIPVRSE